MRQVGKVGRNAADFTKLRRVLPRLLAVAQYGQERLEPLGCAAYAPSMTAMTCVI